MREYAVYRQLSSLPSSYLLSSDVISMESWQAGWLISWLGSLSTSTWKTQCQSRSISAHPAGQCTNILILVWEYKVWLNLLHVNNSVVWLGTCPLKKGLLFTWAYSGSLYAWPGQKRDTSLQGLPLFLWHWTENFNLFFRFFFQIYFWVNRVM